MFIVSNLVYGIMFFDLLHSDFLIITSTKNSNFLVGVKKVAIQNQNTIHPRYKMRKSHTNSKNMS